MRYVDFGRTGLSVSVIGCGSNALRFHDQAVADDVYNYALDQGINWVETGRPYGPTEDMIGRAISHRRGEFYLSSKSVARDAAGMASDIRDSLTALRTDYLDFYLAANVSLPHELEETLGPGGAMEALLEAKAAGVIGHIGMSGHAAPVTLRALESGLFEAALIVFNLIQPQAQQKLIPQARERGIGLMGMRPLEHGALAPAARALDFAYASGIHIIQPGMYSRAEVDENVALALKERSPEDVAAPRAEAATLKQTGCQLCGQCQGVCPVGVSIPEVMRLTHYRRAYGLLPAGEERWAKAARASKLCRNCGDCEAHCPYNLSIVPVVYLAAKTI